MSDVLQIVLIIIRIACSSYWAKTHRDENGLKTAIRWIQLQLSILLLLSLLQ